MADLKNKLHGLLQELIQKRAECEELHQRLNTKMLEKEELKTEIESLTTHVTNVTKQLEFTNKALHKCEESYSGVRESAVKHTLGLSAANKTIESMKDQANKLHVENVRFKKQLENMERDLKAESFFRESCISKLTATQTAIESLTMQIRNLEKDSRDTERHASEALSVGNKIKLMLEHKDKVIVELKTRTAELSAQLVNVTSQNKDFEEKLKEKKPVEKHYVKEILQEWQNAVNEFKSRETSSELESETLHKSLQNALDAQTRFQKLEAAANERVRDLEEKLKNAVKVNKKNCTDCGVQTDLNISIDVACETAFVEVDHVHTQTLPESQVSSNSFQQLLSKNQIGMELSPMFHELTELPTQINNNLPAM